MYGLIVGIKAIEGERDRLVSILHEGFLDVKGCVYHVLAKDNADENVIWVSEAWEGKTYHSEALQTQSVKTAIAKGKPLIAEILMRTEITPVNM